MGTEKEKKGQSGAEKCVQSRVLLEQEGLDSNLVPFPNECPPGTHSLVTWVCFHMGSH
jgi:hypothetical protein